METKVPRQMKRKSYNNVMSKFGSLDPFFVGVWLVIGRWVVFVVPCLRELLQYGCAKQCFLLLLLLFSRQDTLTTNGRVRPGWGLGRAATQNAAEETAWRNGVRFGEPNRVTGNPSQPVSSVVDNWVCVVGGFIVDVAATVGASVGASRLRYICSNVFNILHFRCSSLF